MSEGTHGLGRGGRGEGFVHRRVRSVEELDALAPAWDELTHRDRLAHVFQSHAWLSTWLRCHPGAEPDIPVSFRGERLTAALPFCRHTLGWGNLALSVLRFAADNDSDYCDVLCDPDYPEDLPDLWGEVQAARGWHLMDLRHVPEASHLTWLLKPDTAGLLVDQRQQDIAPFVSLANDWRDFLPKQQRDSILRRGRRLREKGAVSFELATSGQDVEEMLRQLARIHVARWQARGQTSMFCFRHYRDWLQAVCLNLLHSEKLYLCRLALDGDPVSIGLYFLDGRRLLGYVSTFSTDYMEYGPGHLLEAMVIDDVRARGLADVDDFGRGGEEYKLRWSQEVRKLHRILVARRSPVGAPVFWWAAQVQPFLWQHHRLGTVARELRRRAALRRR